MGVNVVFKPARFQAVVTIKTITACASGFLRQHPLGRGEFHLQHLARRAIRAALLARTGGLTGVRGDLRLKRRQRGRSDREIGQRGQVRIRRVVNHLTNVGDLHIPDLLQIRGGILRAREELAVNGLRRKRANSAGNGDG
jgi:hypothetical protein